ncbi:MAG: class I SAM-dependent methyltransferase [Candidatus Paceibacterota bacterium]|jgi:SAM-dependent methyltransferase
MTKLELAVFGNKKCSSLPTTASRQERQAVLDEITEEIMRKLSPEDISTHVREIYDATIDEYATSALHQNIVDELVDFMSWLPQNARVLDMGCGPGRDVLFMSIADEKFRENLMGRKKGGKTTREKFPVPTKTFQVIGVDSSPQMLFAAHDQMVSLLERGLLKHNEKYPHFKHQDISGDLCWLEQFDGVWSCAALFTHTPKSDLAPTINSIAKIIKDGGIFYTTYTNGLAGGKYDKLLMSSTGRIKYFSHPNPDDIAQIAKQCGLVLVSQQFSDMEDKGIVIKKDLFVSQLYRKK